MKNREKVKSVFIYLGLALMVSGNVFSQVLSSYDEIWIYNFARNIVERVTAL